MAAKKITPQELDAMEQILISGLKLVTGLRTKLGGVSTSSSPKRAKNNVNAAQVISGHRKAIGQRSH